MSLYVYCIYDKLTDNFNRVGPIHFIKLRVGERASKHDNRSKKLTINRSRVDREHPKDDKIAKE